MLKLGCHLSIKQGYSKMAEEAHQANANVIQYFMRNPRGGKEHEKTQADIDAFKSACEEYSIKTLVGYAPYTINPASGEIDKKDFAEAVFAEDIAQMEEFPCQFYAFHPGHAMELTHGEAISNAANLLNSVIAPTQTTKLLIVENGGEGTTICSTFEEIAALIAKVNHADHVGVCFDTSAAWAAGYDIVNNLDGVLNKFDKLVGLDKIYAVHLTDSKEGLGSKVNRHATLGKGAIGLDALVRIMDDPRLAGRAFILEEEKPTVQEYANQIALLRNNYKQND